MNRKILRSVLAGLTLSVGIFTANGADAAKNLVIREQGSFMAGGTVVTAPGFYNGVNDPRDLTLHGDHAYV